MQPTDVPPVVPEGEPPKKKKVWLIVLIVVVVLCCCCVVGSYLGWSLFKDTLLSIWNSL